MRKTNTILTIRYIPNGPGCCSYISQAVKFFTDSKSVPCLEAFVESIEDNVNAPISKRRKLSDDEYNKILTQMKRLRIPAFPEKHYGCDGAFWELEFGTEFGGAQYQWWICPPKGWEKMAHFAGKLFDMAEIYPKYQKAEAAAELLEEIYGEELGTGICSVDVLSSIPRPRSR